MASAWVRWLNTSERPTDPPIDGTCDSIEGGLISARPRLNRAKVHRSGAPPDGRLGRR